MMINSNDISKNFDYPSTLTCELVPKIFSSQGWLQKVLNLEHRPQQESMANAVAEALSYESSLLFEAGTGVGKSLAYLIPGIIFAIENQRPFVVSTHTKALQEQIQNNDLHSCRKLFEGIPELKKFASFKTAMLMGRSNYLCTTRLAYALSSRTELFPNDLQMELERLAHWSTITESGIIEELPTSPSLDIWESVNADSSTCNPKNCSASECFFQKAKARIRKSNLIIVNHSLLFTLLNTGVTHDKRTSGILFPEDFLVLDEAHTIPDIATDHFGLHISSFAVERALKTLYNPRTKKGLLVQFGIQSDCILVTQALSASEEFFNLIRQKYLQKNDDLRLLKTPWTEPLICEPLLQLSDRLAILATEQFSELIKETLHDQRHRIASLYNNILRLLALEPQDHVHWVEKSGRNNQLTTIRTAPTNIAPYLKEAIFNRQTSAILTSATLATNNSLDIFKNRIGANNEEGLIETSPFDYEKNVQIFIAKDAPEPTFDNLLEYRKFLSNAIIKAILKTQGGTLVLFTSYADMHAVFAEIENHISQLARPLLVQGQGLSRTQLVEALKTSGNGILLGTDSYWTGIDIPGPALSHVVITRLPFENPSHPIKQAQSELLTKQNLHPFTHLTLPEALIKFRQGLGRLIRKKTDSGIITILDARMLSKLYGKSFIAALPKKSFEILL